MADQAGDRAPVRVPRWLEVVTAYSWRFVIIGIAVVGVAWLAARLRIVVLPVGIALLITVALMPVRRAMTDRGVPVWLAMLGVVAMFFGTVGVAGWVIVPPLIDEFRDLDKTLEVAADDIQEWLVEGPIGLDAELVQDGRDSLERAIEDIRVPEGAVADGAWLAGELLAGLLLSLVVAFFVIKDGPMLQRTILSWFPDRHEAMLRGAGNGAWRALGGYVRGAAMLGAFEAAVIGTTMVLVGAGLALPVAVLTFVAAFFPFVGAITAGIIAVAVALVTSGVAAAGIVAVVAVVVQQLDNDLLAPVIYGKALELHPLVVIIALTSGGALGGIAGAFAAVPIVAVSMRGFAGARAVRQAQLAGAGAGAVDTVADEPPDDP